MAKSSFISLKESLLIKKQKYSTRITSSIDGMPITTFSHGRLKDRFIDDCIYREVYESKMLQHIIETYYNVIDLYPELREKEPNAIKKFIIDRILL